MFEFDGDIFARIDIGSSYEMSLKKPLRSTTSITYMFVAEAAPTDPSLQPIFTGYA